MTVAMLLKNTVDKVGQAVESFGVRFDVWWWCCGVGHVTVTMPLRNAVNRAHQMVQPVGVRFDL